MIKIEGLCKTFGARTALAIDHLTIEQGCCYALIGGNGSGKSTLLRVLAGVLTPDAGALMGLPETIGFLPQKPYVFGFSVLKNVMLTGVSKPQAQDALRRVGLEQLANKRGDRLSGGETQRLCFARLLTRNCGLLLLDEPTSATDLAGCDLLEAALRDYREQTGCTVLVSTHSPAQAARVSGEVIALEQGRVLERGTPKQILSNPQTMQLQQFLSHWRY